MNILAIETSCDETSCAIVKDGIYELSSVISSSAQLHEKTGGIVPEVAARKQVEAIIPVLEECLAKSGLKVPQDIDKIAVTVGPGLIGSLVVGIEAAKALALVWDRPITPVNHLIGHIYGNYVNNSATEKMTFPAVALVVSGGHTDLVLMKNHGNFVHLGGTLDDAAGEAFDKVARLLGLSRYLGGALLSKKALESKTRLLKNKLPRPMINQKNYDFSFSGLKTAVKNVVASNIYPGEDIAHEFEQAVVDVLVSKTIAAALAYSAKTILLGGGVSANSYLRTKLVKKAQEKAILAVIPPLSMCGDNAAYIASAAYFNNHSKPLAQIVANPSLGITDL